MDRAKNSTTSLILLSHLLLSADEKTSGISTTATQRNQEMSQALAMYGPQEFGGLWGLASSHHVIMRAFPRLQDVMLAEGSEHSDWVDRAIVKERARIEHALSFLSPICDALSEAGDLIVIKSLDHWPDLGSDIDLYSNAQGSDIVAIMQKRFNAKVAERSWGDRLANKWNFVVPGLPELLEVHVGRLGQTGEQVAITDSLVQRSTTAEFGGYTFRVPAAE